MMVPVLFMNICQKQGPSLLLYHLAHCLSDQKHQLLLLDEYPTSNNLSHIFHISPKFDIAQVLHSHIHFDGASVSVNHIAFLSCARYARESVRYRESAHDYPTKTLSAVLDGHYVSFDHVFVSSLYAPHSLSAYGFSVWDIFLIVDTSFFSYKSLLKKLIHIAIHQKIQAIYLVMTELTNHNADQGLAVIRKIIDVCAHELAVPVYFIASLPKEHEYLSANVLKKPIYRIFPDSFSAAAIQKIAGFFQKDNAKKKLSSRTLDFIAS